LKQKKWLYKCRNLDRNTVLEFSKKYSLSPIIATLLFNRGLDSEEKVRSFFSKSIKDVHNPKLLIDADAAADRIISAVNNKEKIAVYGDYDVDGIISTALMYDFLKGLGADVMYYIPDRMDEGYGINIMAVNKLSKMGVKLMVTVDCGITAVGEVEFAKLQGMEIVITDHHTCKEKLPRAVAAVDLKREENEYPFNALAGVGVAFKLMLYIVMKLGLNTTEYFNRYADFCAIGTVADVVSLTDENRIIVNRGTAVLSNTKREGLKALIELAGLKPDNIKSEDIAFGIAPRLNAAGRMGSAETALKLLLTDSSEEAAQYAAELNLQNEKRKQTEAEIFEEALSQIASDANFDLKKVIVVCGNGWHHGVIGIVASKLTERFYKPCIVLSEENGVCKGSARSIPAFNLFDALEHCDKLLKTFGGHSGAAGLTLGRENLDEFSGELNNYAKSVLTDEDMIPVIEIECELAPKSATIDFVKRLSNFEPFGEENETPVFSMKEADVAYISKVGKDMTHLRMVIVKDGISFNCIGFGMGAYSDYISKGDGVNIAFGIGINSYNGTDSVQFYLKDIQTVK